MTDYIFTTDWFSNNIPIWEFYLKDFKDKSNLKFLEIGCYQGRSTIWLLENILTSDTSNITCIDTFEGSQEHTNEEKNKILEIFNHNISKFKNKVTILKGESQKILRDIINYNMYDLIYIDGDHRSKAVLEDAILSRKLLKSGGFLIFDDYLWLGSLNQLENPKFGIDIFLTLYRSEFKILHINNQLILQKI